jgi:two-component system sensor histidine kinase KdpD
VLVDELAHTNAPGSRHPKRYQDVLELLDAGIDVYSTLNVQHLESRMDVVQQITGVAVREAVPDSVLDQADEIELVDLTPDQLRKRLAEGKVYLGERAAMASENFFLEENLTALREMALRTTAEHVDQELRDVMRAKRMGAPWKSAQRLAVGVGPSPYSGVLIRWTRRIAAAMDAPWVAIYVETSAPMNEEEKTRLTKNLSLARQLGAEVVMTTGDDVASALLTAAREAGVTQVVVGKPLGNPVLDFLKGGSLASRLIRRGGDIDVHVVSGEKQGARQRRRSVTEWLGSNLLRDCGWGAVAVAVVTGVSWLLQGVTGYWAVALLYLLAVVLLAMVLNRWAVLFVATLSALLWNFLFIPPILTFRISHVHDAMMFAMYFVIAIVIGHFTNQLRTREAAERRREQRTRALNRLLESVTGSASLADGLASAVKEVDALFNAHTAIVLDGVAHPASTFQPDEKELAVAAWALEKAQTAGRFTDTLPDTAGIYFPLQTANHKLGVMGVRLEGRATLTLDERDLLETFASQIALVIERERLREEAHSVEVLAQAEQLHRTLLNSVSHELRIPIAAVLAATENLEKRTPPSEQGLVSEIREAALRLDMLVRNLLNAARLETGMLQPKMEWFEVGELVNAVLEHHFEVLEHHELSVSLPDGLPLVYGDFGLLQQALANLVHNAMRHTPTGTEIKVTAAVDGDELLISVMDNGPGFGADDPQKLFQKFQRGSGAAAGGSGLGLSIVKGFVEANGGTVEARNRPGGGAQVTITLPLQKQPQELSA